MDNVIQMREQSPTWCAAGRLPRAGVAEHSRLGDLLELMGADLRDPPPGADRPIPVRQLHAGEALFHEGALAEAIHFVRAGTFKSFRTAEDGYEQVLGFVGRAEILGFDAICRGSHPTGAVALEKSSVYVVLLRDLGEWGQLVPEFEHMVHRSVSSALSNRCEMAGVMAAVAAEVRLSRFLLQLSRRMVAAGHSARRFRLRMIRRDIASYLGVAHETVSRSFSALADLGLIVVDQREVEIVDMDGLHAFSRNTRRHFDDVWANHHSRPAAATANARLAQPEAA